MAGLLLSGGSAVSQAVPAQLLECDVRLTDLQVLPGVDAAQAVFSCKLFQNVGIGRAQPIHRVIAEFLAARWLAQQALTPRTVRRLLTQFHASGVPSSLRGLHAWLAFHSSTMAKAVIAADPIGLLLYGDAASLTLEQVEYLFDSLTAQAEIDPYFHSGNWGSGTASGLMIPNLQTRIEATIRSTDSNAGLRYLLIKGLIDAPLASKLTETLQDVMLSREHNFDEREAAASALMPYRDRSWWQRAIASLHDQGAEDSIRLALKIIDERDFDVTDDLLAAILFAELGVTICPYPRVKGNRSLMLHFYDSIVDALPVDRLFSLLNALSDYAPFLPRGDHFNEKDLATLVSLLITRAIDEQVIRPDHAALLWNWLEMIQRAAYFSDKKKASLQARLDEHIDLRHAVQFHALYVEPRDQPIWIAEVYLDRRLVGLARRPNDVTWLLDQLGNYDNDILSLRSDWCDLMRLGMSSDGFSPVLREASLKFQRGDAHLEAFVRKLEAPTNSVEAQKQERLFIRQERRQRFADEMERREYIANRLQLRVGHQGFACKPAQAYLGLLDHLKGDRLPEARLFDWLGPELGPPSNIEDMTALVLEIIAVVQEILLGDDLDQVRIFWDDDVIPHDENRCRDHLALMIGPELMRYGIQRITEADMPKSKRADLAFALGTMQLPMEVKGQWHKDVWQAATDQLDQKYLIDWRSEQRGIYCVLWFGRLKANTGRRLQTPPQGLQVPQTAEEFRQMLIESIPQPRRSHIDVVVIDFTAIKRTQQ